MAIFTALTAPLVGLGLATIEFDPRSSDWGKLKVGKTRIDLSAGYAPLIRYAAQAATGTGVSAGSGAVSERGRVETIQRFARSKLSPIAGMISDIALGQDFLGDDLLAPKDIAGFKDVPGGVGYGWENFAPLFIQDVEEGVRLGGLEGGLAGATGGLGAGVVSYETVADTALDVYGREYGELEPHEQRAADEVYRFSNPNNSDYGVQSKALDEDLRTKLWQLSDNPMGWDKRALQNGYYTETGNNRAAKEALRTATFGEDSQYVKPNGASPRENAALQEYYDFLENNTAEGGPLFDIVNFGKRLTILEIKWQAEGTLKYVQRNTHYLKIPPALWPRLAESTRERIWASAVARAEWERDNPPVGPQGGLTNR